MGLFSKLFHGFFYVVNEETLKKYLQNEVNFSIENELEASADLNIYFNNEKHHIQILVNTEENTVIDKEVEKSITIYYDDTDEYNSLDGFYSSCLNNLPEFFKIELINTDDAFLNEFKKAHPELNVEDY